MTRVDRLGPLLAAASPGTAELHHQDVAFELLEGIPLVIDALELEVWGRFPHQGALPGLRLGWMTCAQQPISKAANKARPHQMAFMPSAFMWPS